MIILCLLLASCGQGGQGGGSKAEQLALEIRTEYIGMTACTASMDVTADYGERVYRYGMGLTWEKDAQTVLTLTSPEDVAGVTVRIEAGETALEFDGARIETGALSPDGLSPVDSVPALLDWVKEGFIAECAEETLGEVQTLRVCYRDPDAAAGTGTEASVWFDTATHGLVRGEVSVDGATVIQCAFTDFQMV
ncbi:hypothetical protein H8S62_14485 [Lawsonibacter sp. NSJ-52]|uniref:Lipoprotein n=2 Tax=Lawsonibacter faecis TaxID=2763052 RepID=A0A8J6J902_9FIRM|nr:hypothetical protein [Lawsonibacter faecis]